MRILVLLALVLTFACTKTSDDTADSPSGIYAQATLNHGLAGNDFAEPFAAEDLDPDPNVVKVAFIAAAHDYQIDTQEINGYAYNGQVPGPTIYAQTGDRLEVALTNALDVPTTLHWHGLHVPIEMDGVTWQRDPVMPGETFTYAFELNQSGTYWYHPHFDTERTMDLGLYGVIVVLDPEEPLVDDDVLLVFDSWLEHESKQGVMDHGAIDGKARHWTVNGVLEPTLTFEGGQVIRARIVNVSNGGFLHLRWPQMELIGGDQGLLAALQPMESVVLAPGDRIEALWRIGTEGFRIENLPYTVLGGEATGDAKDVLEVAVTSPAPTPNVPAFTFSGALPTPDPTHTDVVYVFHGSSYNGTWMMNGETFPDVTIQSLALHSEGVIEVRNLSGAEHPFHLHGYGFEVLSVNEVTPAYRRMEDTINLKIYQTARLRLVANNPGDWMVHCHILSHQSGGMMTVLRVE